MKKNEKKKSFILYYDYRNHLNLLSDSEKGKLLMALFDYAEFGTKPTYSGAIGMAFSFISAQMDRDNESYEKKCQKNRTNGEKGGRPSDQEETEENPKEPNVTQNNPSEPKETQNNPNKPNITQRNPSEPKKPYNDNDTDNDNDNDNDLNNIPDKPVKTKKRKYGSYQNVLLSDEDLKRLKQKFPSDWESKIESLSEGIELKGYKYKNHYLAVLKWADRDHRQSQPERENHATYDLKEFEQWNREHRLKDR